MKKLHIFLGILALSCILSCSVVFKSKNNITPGDAKKSTAGKSTKPDASGQRNSFKRE